MGQRSESPDLVADLGGTNTRVGILRAGMLDRASIRRYRNQDFSGLADVLDRYRADTGHKPAARLCLAAAGLVEDGRVSMTNLDWDISRTGLAQAAGLRQVLLLNDLQAQGYGLNRLAPASLSAVFAPATRPRSGPSRKLVIGIGTGFNAAVVHPPARPGRGVLVAPSETGHITLPVTDAAGLGLAAYLGRAHGMASVEDALSGRGLAAIDAWLAQGCGAAGQRAPAAVLAALATGEARAAEAVALFVTLLGRVAGDLALIHLPFGGLYLAGGVARAVAPHLVRFGIEDAFRSKGRMTPFMAPFGLRVIEDDFAALEGCAAFLADADMA